MFLTHIQTQCNPTCCCTLLPVDGEIFDFFPLSFLYYTIFMAFLCLLIITVEVMAYYDEQNELSTIDLIFGYSIESYHNHSVSRIHVINAEHIVDYILIYSFMIFCVWQSLFSFYRYYSTLYSTRKFESHTTRKLFQAFKFFAATFCALFLMSIHIYYYFYPLPIIAFISFNCWCTYKFAAMLIERCSFFASMQRTDTGTQDIIRHVRFTKNTSLVSCILQSIYLSAFLITYNVNILYYFPILWSLSAFVLALNFVRNLKYIQEQMFIYKRYLQCICCTRVSARSPRKIQAKAEKANPLSKVLSPKNKKKQKKRPADNDYHLKPNATPVSDNLSSTKSSHSSNHSQKYSENLASFEKRMSAIDMDSIEEEMPEPAHNLHMSHSSRSVDSYMEISKHVHSRQTLPSSIQHGLDDNDLPNTQFRAHKSDPTGRRKVSFMRMMPEPIDTKMDTYCPPKRNRKALTLLGVGGDLTSHSNPMKNLRIPKPPKLQTIISQSLTEDTQDVENENMEYVENEYEKYLDENDEPMPESPVSKHEVIELQLTNIDSKIKGTGVIDESKEMTLDGANSSNFVSAFQFNHPAKSDRLSAIPDILTPNSSRSTVTPAHVESMLEMFTKFGFLKRENINSVKQLNKYQQAMMNKAAMAKSSP